MSFDKDTRNLLAKTVAACRRRLAGDVTDQLRGVFGLHPDGVVLPLEKLTHLSPDQHAAARRLRDLLDHYTAGAAGKDSDRRKAAYERMVLEISFTALNRLAALRLCEERGLVVECVRKGTTSAGFQMFERISGGALGGRYDTYRVFLECLFDELALDLGVLFDRMTPQSAVFPSERCMEDVLAELNKTELMHLWTEDETIGWVYQYFNPPEERKAMRDASQAPRNSRELAVRNQFFTPRYVVEFLTDNTLGRIWYEMRKGDTVLKEECRYLVRRPNEVFLGPGEKSPAGKDDETDLSQEELFKRPVYIEHRPKKDPRDLRVLDPACGSGHFLLYAFDLLERIYEEAWEEQYAVCSRLKAEGDNDEWEELSGSGRLAESDGSGGDDLRGDQEVPEGRIVWDHIANPQGGCLDTIEHSGGAREDIKQGVSELSVDSPRLAEGSRNADIDRSKTGVSAVQGSASDLGLGGRNGTIDQRALELALKEIGYDYSDSAYRPLPTAYPSRDAFLKAVPKMIVEHNLHGIDIDPRAVQIAALALWLRAQKTWKNLGLKAQERPRIARSNIVTAEPMPGEEDMRREFTAGLKPRVLGQIVDEVFEKMKVAGEAGSLLKIEEEIKDAVAAAKKLWAESPREEQLFLFSDTAPRRAPSRFDFSDLKRPAGSEDQKTSFSLPTAHRLLPTDFWDQAEDRILDALKDYAEQAENGRAVRRRLFAEDAARGFAFIDLCRKRYDVVLMNPPFGVATKTVFALLKKTMPSTYTELYSAFVRRALDISRSDGLVGAITSRAFLYISRLASFRQEALVARMSVLLDLAGNVMDDALVEACAYTVNARRPSDCLVAFDARDEAIRGSLCRLVGGICDVCDRHINAVPWAYLSTLPSGKFLYYLPREISDLLRGRRVFEPEIGTVRQGMGTFDDFRFVHLLWEVPHRLIGEGRGWEPLSKGGPFAKYYSPIHLAVNWSKNGAELCEVNILRNGQTAQVRQASDYWRLGGCTYSKRSAKGFSARALPRGCIMAGKGPAIISQSKFSERYFLGWLNSRLITGLVELQANAYEFNTGILKNLPWLTPDESEYMLVDELAHEAAIKARSLNGQDETDPCYTFQPHITGSLGEYCRYESTAQQSIFEELARIDGLITSTIDKLYGVDSSVLTGAFGDEGDTSDDGDDNEDVYNQRGLPEEYSQLITSGCVGVAFGRWDVRIALDPTLAPKLPDPFDPLPVCPPGMLVGQDGLPAEPGGIVSEEWLRARPDANSLPPDGSVKNPTIPDSEYPLRISWDGVLVDDPGFNGDRPHRDDMVRRVREVFDLLWKDKSHEIEQEACDILGVSDLRDYFRKPAGFFQDHLKRYSKSRRKAPIYWPISTASGSYTIWLYYHRLNDQTLYMVVNRYVEPKIAEVQKAVDSMRYAVEARERGITEKQPTAYSLLPTATLRKQWEEARAFLSELRDLREELLRIAALPYKPDLNDGVIINAAPLHKLFRLRSWAKDTEDCWKTLEKGDYDWAHLAYTIWSDRVREVCKRDRSIAIAHGLEDLCEVEAPESKKKDGRGRRKKEAAR